jgi:hypothetical protein
MYVPSGLAARLKHQQGLQCIAWSIHVEVYMFLRAVTLRLRHNLQWDRLAIQMAQVHQTQSKHSRRRGYAKPE